MSECNPDSGSDNPPKNQRLAPSQRDLGGLALIAIYKLIKAVIAITGVIILVRLGHQNLVHVAHGWLVHLGLDPEGRFEATLLSRLTDFDSRRVHLMVGIFSAYAILYCVEAVGLLREKRWAEWLTVVQTLILVPVELYEIGRRPGPLKILALSFSLGVVLYLVWRIQRDDRLRA